jgi:hypothetical protein
LSILYDNAKSCRVHKVLEQVTLAIVWRLLFPTTCVDEKGPQRRIAIDRNGERTVVLTSPGWDFRCNAWWGAAMGVLPSLGEWLLRP